MKVQIRRMAPEGVIPSYSIPGDAGLDLVAISKRITPDFIEYGTGLAIAVPDDHVGLLFPRSSVSKQDLILANCVGVIDSNYRGEILIRFKRIPNPSNAITHQALPYLTSSAAPKSYEIGERVAQLIIMPIPHITFEEVEHLDASQRGDQGFGSTGK